jgi:hypothetical protein
MLPAARIVVRDEQGTATLEGIIVLAVFAGMFCACLLLGQWSTSLQSGQMGARLMAFDAGDVELARLGRPSRRPAQQFVNQGWVGLFNSQTANWLSGMFALVNGQFSGSVADTTHGRLPGQSALFDFSRTTMKYRTDGWTATPDPWALSDSAVRLRLLTLAYYVGRYQVGPQNVDSTLVPGIPIANAILETVYTRIGVR